MQKGFATLEIVLITLIIAVLGTATFPNFSRVIDRASLDYETKRLYTQLRAVQAFDRMTIMKDTHFNTNDEKSVVSVEFLDDNKTYLIRNRNLRNKLYESHSLPEGFIFSSDGTEDFSYIKFDDMGKPRAQNTSKNPSGKILDGHIRINSRFNKDSYIFFNTIGRFHGGQEWQGH